MYIFFYYMNYWHLLMNQYVSLTKLQFFSTILEWLQIFSQKKRRKILTFISCIYFPKKIDSFNVTFFSFGFQFKVRICIAEHLCLGVSVVSTVTSCKLSWSINQGAPLNFKCKFNKTMFHAEQRSQNLPTQIFYS